MHDPDQVPQNDKNQGSLLDNKPQQQESKAETKSIPKVQQKPEQKSENGLAKPQGTSVTDRITSINTAQAMVLKYANKLVASDRAQQFYTQVMLMMRNNPQLAKTDPQSLFTAMMACVHLDL